MFLYSKYRIGCPRILKVRNIANRICPIILKVRNSILTKHFSIIFDKMIAKISNIQFGSSVSSQD